MKRATTPRHTFSIPIDPNTVAQILFTYAQNGDIILEKTGADAVNEGGAWTITLTQEETNLFQPDYADVQVRVLTVEGKAMASEIMRLNVGAVLNDEVMA